MADERALVRRLQDGETAAFRELVERYKQRVYYLALDLSGDHHDAEDISQEVFIKAFRGIKRFRSGAKLSSWLHKITVNAYIDTKRKKSSKMVTLVEREKESGFNPLENAADEAAPSPEQFAAAAKISEHVEAALQRLSAQERTVFVLRHYHDMPLKDISHNMDVAEGTVKSLLFRGIRKMRDQLSYYREELGLED